MPTLTTTTAALQTYIDRIGQDTDVPLTFADALDNLDAVIDVAPVYTTLSASQVDFDLGTFAVSVTGTNFGPVGSAAALTTAIEDAVATGTFAAITVRDAGQTILTLTPDSAGYTLTSGNTTLQIDGTLPGSFQDLFAFGDALDAFETLISENYFEEVFVSPDWVATESQPFPIFPDDFFFGLVTPSDEQVAEVVAALAAYDFNGVRLSQNGQELGFLSLRSDALSIGYNGIALTATGTFPADLGAWAQIELDALEAGTDDYLAIGNYEITSAVMTGPDGETLLSAPDLGADGPEELVVDGVTYTSDAFLGDDGADEASIETGPAGTRSFAMTFGGEDAVFADGAGALRAVMGAGRDFARGDAGNDSLEGGADQDTLEGHAGFDLLIGGDGDDDLSGGTEFDTIFGGAGNDTVDGGNGRDLVFLNEGDDLYVDNAQGGELGRDTVFAGFGDDTIEGGGGDDVFHGEWGADVITAGAGDDVVFAGDDDDLVSAGQGNDTVFGGNGRDLVYLNQGDDLFVDTAQGGPEGSDTVFTGFGDDTVEGGNGGDVIYGEAGNDLINARLGDDTVYGGANFDTINAGAGDDRVWGGNGRDLVFLNQGDDIYYDNAQGGDLGRDTVFAGFGDDTIQGGNGDDDFRGEWGNDLILARLGDDTLDGGSGSDTLTGGAGADTFVFAATDAGDGVDSITDFERGIDILQIVGATAADTAVTVAATGFMIVSVGGNDVALVDSADDLTGFGVGDIAFL